MSSVIIQGDSSGSVTLQAPAAAGSTVINLPSTSMNMGNGGGNVATNTAFGASALAANTTGANNTVVGYQAGFSNTTNTGSTAFGSQAGYSSTVVVDAFGYQSLYANTTGLRNASFGIYSLAANTTGSSNNAFGRASLGSNTTGSSNTAFGDASLTSNTTASNNTAVGYQAGYKNTTAGYNVFLGEQAGFNSNSTNGSNTCVGAAAGYSLTTGYGNTFVGTSYSANAAGFYVTSGNNNTIIGGFSGNQGGLNITTANNYIVLSDGDGNPRLFTNAGGFLRVSNSGTWYVTTAGQSHTINNDQPDDTWQMVNSNASTPYGAFVRFTGADPNNTTSYVFGAYANTSSTFIYRIWSNGTVSARSDARLKKNIEPARDGYLEDLNKIGIVKYNWYNSEEGAPKELGWIAQQIETVFPGLVQTDVAEDGTESKSVKLSVFTPILIKALQELNAKVEAQAAEIAQLKGQA